MRAKELTDRYERLLPVNRELHEAAIDTIPRWAMQQGAKKLGITFSGSTLKFKSGWEVHLLLQFVLYELPYRESSIMKNYLHTVSDADDADYSTVLKGLGESFATLFEVCEIEGETLTLSDLLSQEKRHLLVNTGLSKTAKTGMLIYTRLIAVPEFCMTTGASMPFGAEEKDKLVKLLSQDIPEEPQQAGLQRFRKCFGHFRQHGEPTEHWKE